MKVFFAVSLRAAIKYKSEFTRIFNQIEKLGHINLNTLPISSDPQEFYQNSEQELKQIHIDLSKKIKEADILVVETTIHSLTMGFYTKMSLDLDKPTILLHKPGSVPYFFQGIQNDRLQIVEYTLENLEEVLTAAIEYARESLDIRFNLMINTELNEYLKWAAKKSSTPRSNFVRNLILEHKRTNIHEYLEDMKK